MSAPPGSSTPLKAETARSGSLGQCLDPAVIKIPASVEDDLLDPFFKTFLGDKFSHFLGCFNIPWIFEIPSKFRAHRRNTDYGFSCRIHNGLGIDMFQTPENIQAWPVPGSRDTAPYSLLPFLSSKFLLVLQWFILPASARRGPYALVFPTFLRMCSPR